MRPSESGASLQEHAQATNTAVRFLTCTAQRALVGFQGQVACIDAVAALR
jgi:hypothetical protein